MKSKFYKSSVLFLVLIFNSLNAQHFNLPSEYFSSVFTQKVLAKKDSAHHSSIQPYIHFFSNKYSQAIDSHNVYKYVHEDEGVDAVFYDHLFEVKPKNENFYLRIDPIVNFELGKDFSDTISRKIFNNTRGIVASCFLGDKVYLETQFSETQSFFPNYLSNGVKSLKTVPGQGRYKTFKVSGYDYAFASGFASIQVAKNFNLQVGHGKQKIGNGYRSLLLSDNAFNYPYVRFTEQFFKGRIQYSSIYAALMNFYPASKKQSSGIETLLQKKAASFQYVSINVSKRINLSLFQGLVWQAGDNRNRQNISWQYLNPIVYSNLAYYKLNNQNNLLIGADLKIKLSNKLNIYYQAMADDLSNKDSLGNGYGNQAGLNYFDALGIKNLFFQAEYNYVSEGSYRNGNFSFDNSAYNHYGQSLANTISKGQELILIADYKYRRLFMNFKFNYQDVPLKNKPYYYSNILNVKFGYTINTAYNLNIAVGCTYRNQNFTKFKNLNNETGYFYLALKTNLYNYYYDF